MIKYTWIEKIISKKSPLYIVKSILRDIGMTIEDLKSNIEKSIPKVYETDKACPKVIKIDDRT